tara:strand:+ start:435 stop:740 length:306 start_codon:yes stop_codon:yes gene_type:complete
MLDPVERDFNAFSKSQSYAEDFDEAVNERMQQEVDKYFDNLIVSDVKAYMDDKNELTIELDGDGFRITPEALEKLVKHGGFLLQEYDDAMSEENDKQRQWD